VVEAPLAVVVGLKLPPVAVQFTLPFEAPLVVADTLRV
jgi:hypothetical protein